MVHYQMWLGAVAMEQIGLLYIIKLKSCSTIDSILYIK